MPSSAGSFLLPQESHLLLYRRTFRKFFLSRFADLGPREDSLLTQETTRGTFFLARAPVLRTFHRLTPRPAGRAVPPVPHGALIRGLGHALAGSPPAPRAARSSSRQS